MHLDNAARSGEVGAWLFLAMTHRRLGRPEKSADAYNRFEQWFLAKRFECWQEKLRWHLLRHEAGKMYYSLSQIPN